MLRFGLLIVLPISLIGCLAAAPPRLAERDGWRVRAADDATATLVADLVADLAPRVRDELGGSTAAPCEVWVQEELRYYTWPFPAASSGGFYVPSRQRIHVPASRMTGPLELARFVLAHELVHELRDETWARLDARLEEGLADLVGCRVVPDAAPELEAERLLDTAAPAEGMPLWITFADDTSTALTRLGHDAGADDPYGEVDSRDYGPSFVVLRRLQDLGLLPALRAACLAAEGEDDVTLEDAARLAGVDLDEDAVAALARSQVSRAALRVLLARIADDIATALAVRRRPDSDDPEADFTRMDPRFSLPDSGVVIVAAEVPGLREAFVRARRALLSAPAAER